MKALVLENYNASFVLKDIDKPASKPGEVLVKVKASGINPLDLKIKAGQAAHAHTQLPAILGIDMAGVVEAVGEGITPFKPGDRVFGMTGGIAGIPGSLAEYASVDAALLAKMPANISFKQAAALPLVLITAWEALVDKANVGPGKTVLIHGGAGGVGHIAVQLAVARGAKVFTTVSHENESLITGYGAIPIFYKESSVEEYVNQRTNGDGFDIVLDTVGGAVLDDSFRAVKRYTGHAVSILGWGTHSLAPLSFRGGTYSGVFTLYPLISGEGRAHHGQILADAGRLIEAGKLLPNVDERTFGLADVEEAYAIQAAGGSRGKLVVDID
ncbi:zinc-dependent alcohol dehydrogenase family protein [Mucilaginibacter pedocola]|uniref:Quinone oxidoreductase n=1 Tax=Mucilaginibacter pedocola TaxID=1792845 RepID=A0A1S9P8N1_9SPHI|nr:zinc-dependent alcohol dehydrogenase family protein [Mucilaginibacter pedocola]OOQ57305.1 quinone oxidoreductase [Mucilaginibacter pedocola]